MCGSDAAFVDLIEEEVQFGSSNLTGSTLGNQKLFGTIYVDDHLLVGDVEEKGHSTASRFSYVFFEIRTGFLETGKIESGNVCNVFGGEVRAGIQHDQPVRCNRCGFAGLRIDHADRKDHTDKGKQFDEIIHGIGLEYVNKNW